MKPTPRWLAIFTAAAAAAVAAAFALRGGTERTEPAVSAPPPMAAWRHQLELAQLEAQWRGVDLLLWFHADSAGESGESLRREVFDDEEIRGFLQQSFCIVELRRPGAAVNPELPDELAGLFGVRPLVLADSEGRPYALPRRYVDGEGADFAQELVESCAVRERRDAAFAVAADATGLARASALAAALAEMDRELVVQAYAVEAREVADLDPDDAAGLGDRHARLARMGEVEPLVRTVHDVALAASPEVTPQRLKQLLAPIELAHADVPEVLQAARYWVAVAQARLVLDEEGAQAMAREFEAVRAIVPESWLAERIGQR